MSVPVIKFDEQAARKAWAEFLAACEDEKAARAKRIQAHQRFMAAFMGAGE